MRAPRLFLIITVVNDELKNNPANFSLIIY